MPLRSTWIWRDAHFALVAVLMVALGATALRIALAMDSGLERLCNPRRSQRCICLFERYHEGAASHLPESFADELARLEGVIGVLGETWAARDAKTTFEQAPIRICDLRRLDVLGDHFSGDVTTIREWFEQRSGGVTMFDPITGRQRFGAVVGRNLARRWKVQKGDLTSVAVAGGGSLELFILEVTDGRGTIDDVSLFVERDALPSLGRDAEVHTMYWVRLDARAELQPLLELIERLSQRLPPAVTAVPESEFISQRVLPVRDILQVGLNVSLLGLFTVMALLSPLFLALLSGRQRELGLVQILGTPAERLSQRLMIEAGLVGLLGGGLACWASRWLVANVVPGAGAAEVFVPVSLYVSRDLATVGVAVVVALVAAWWPIRWTLRHAVELHFTR